MKAEWSRNVNADPIGRKDKARVKGVQDLIAHLLQHQTGDPFPAMSEHWDQDPVGLKLLQEQPASGVGYTEQLKPMLPDKRRFDVV